MGEHYMKAALACFISLDEMREGPGYLEDSNGHGWIFENYITHGRYALICLRSGGSELV